MEVVSSGLIKSQSDFKRSCWPSVARISDRILAAVYSGGRHAHICPFGRVEMSVSFDEGRTWSIGKTVFDTPLDDRDAGIAVWKGRIAVTSFNNSIKFQKECLKKWSDGRSADQLEYAARYLDSISRDTESANLGSTIMFSKKYGDVKSLTADIAGNDGKIIFEEFKKLPIMTPHGPIVLSDDRLFYVGKAFSPDQSWNTGFGKFLYFMTAKDTDDWSLPQLLPYHEDYELYEPHAVEYEKGKILVAARAADKDGNGTILLSRSVDFGKRFTPFKKTGFEGVPPHLYRLKSGKILLTYCRRKPPYSICARTSADGGKTWSDEIRIREDGYNWDIGYPASLELTDGKILTVYYFNTGQNPLPQVYYTIWGL